MSNRVSYLERIRTEIKRKLTFTDRDDYVVDLVCCTLIGTLHPLIPEFIWVHVIGPPSGGKTSVLLCFSDCKEYFQFVSELTDNSLMSGKEINEDKGETDPSLLTKINDKVLVVKDLSSVADCNPNVVAKIYGTLRDAYDGSSSKASGSAGLREYQTNFGIAICTTPILDVYMENHQTLGERFVNLRIRRNIGGFDARVDAAMAATAHLQGDKMLTEDIQLKVGAIVRAMMLKVVGRSPVLPDDDMKRKIHRMAELICQFRSSPLSESITTEQTEVSIRLSRQLLCIGMARVLADERTEWNSSDLMFLKRLCVDSLPGSRLKILEYLWRMGGQYRNKVAWNKLSEVGGMELKKLTPVLMQYRDIGVLELNRETLLDDSNKPIYDANNCVRKIWMICLSETAHKGLRQTTLFNGKHMPSEKRLWK